MIKSSIIVAKVKRSGIKFKDTFLWKERPNYLMDDRTINLLLSDDEEILILYIGENNYRWLLTNKRLLIPNQMRTIFLSNIKRVGFSNLEENPSEKMTNKELDLITLNNKFTVYFEEKTWPVFYDLFRFIATKNEKIPLSEE